MKRSWIVGSVVAVALIVAAVLAVVVVSGGDDSSTSSPTTRPEGMPGGSEELQACLEEQGIEVPQGGAPGEGAPSQPDPSQGQAFEACQEFLPDDLPSGGGFPAPPGG